MAYIYFYCFSLFYFSISASQFVLSDTDNQRFCLLVANSVDPDQSAPKEQSNQGQHYLPSHPCKNAGLYSILVLDTKWLREKFLSTEIGKLRNETTANSEM